MSDGAYRRAWITSQKSDGADAGDRLANGHLVGDGVAGGIVLVIESTGLVRLAVAVIRLLLQARRHIGALSDVDPQLATLERPVHRHDAILHGGVFLRSANPESRLLEQGDVRGGRVDCLAAAARGVGVNDYLVALVAAGQRVNQGGRVIDAGELVYRVPAIRAPDVH